MNRYVISIKKHSNRFGKFKEPIWEYVTMDDNTGYPCFCSSLFSAISFTDPNNALNWMRSMGEWLFKYMAYMGDDELKYYDLDSLGIRKIIIKTACHIDANNYIQKENSQ